MSASTTAGLSGTHDYDRPTAGEDAHTILINRVSWGAIFAGVVVGLVVQVLLTMLRPPVAAIPSQSSARHSGRMA